MKSKAGQEDIILGDIMREMSIDGETRSTLPDRETRKWMAAQANVTIMNGEMVSNFIKINPLLQQDAHDNQEEGPNKFKMPNQAQVSRMKKAYTEIRSNV